jgi:hypothetical protein
LALHLGHPRLAVTRSASSAWPRTYQSSSYTTTFEAACLMPAPACPLPPSVDLSQSTLTQVRGIHTYTDDATIGLALFCAGLGRRLSCAPKAHRPKSMPGRPDGSSSLDAAQRDPDVCGGLIFGRSFRPFTRPEIKVSGNSSRVRPIRTNPGGPRGHPIPGWMSSPRGSSLLRPRMSRFVITVIELLEN